jgi:syntaxin-binding protein 1
MVLDSLATRVISAALTMYDIMEQRVTTVEQLSMNRAPFPEMDVLYFCAPTEESVKSICNDFPNNKPGRYGSVHLFFTDIIPDDIMNILQSAPNLIAKVKTLRELNLDFVAAESNAFHLDLKDSLPRLLGSAGADELLQQKIAKKLATFCISLNEHPSIRYQGNSRVAANIAKQLNEYLKAYRRANPKGAFNGDDAQGERERAQLLLVDRTFDPLTPIMHEYSYQCMSYDLLNVEGDNIISYSSTNNKNETVLKQALLGENDPLWVELRHDHIAKVIEKIKTRMNDIIQNSSGAALAKKSGANMSITNMAAAVKELPEFTQTMSKLSQHVALAQQCMDVFGKQALMDLSTVEQTISTGADDNGGEVKGAKLTQLVIDTVRTLKNKALKKRLIAIYVAAQRNVTPATMNQIMDAAGFGPNETVVPKLELLCKPRAPEAVAEPGKAGIFSSIFGGARKTQKIAATAEGEYADTRHVCALKAALDQLIGGELPQDKFPALGPSISSSSEAKANAKSMRRYGANNRWGKRESNITGSRCICFVVGGVAFSELRAGYELQTQHSKEVIMGGTHFVAPEEFLEEVSKL